MVDVDETTVLLVTFVVLLLPFPLASFGTRGAPDLLWQVGLALLVVAGVVPPLTRYVFDDEDEDAADGEATDEDGESDGGGE